MAKRIFIIHSWSGRPTEMWYPWVAAQLRERGFTVEVPEMPEPDEPRIELMVPFLRELVGAPDEQTFFIGHSIGNQTILRYLASLPEGTRVGGVVHVAPWLTLTGLEGPEEEEIARPWLETPIDFAKVRSHCNNFTAIFSDNDYHVAPENWELFKQNLNAKIIVEHDKGHFSSEENIEELPSVVESILEMESK